MNLLKRLVQAAVVIPTLASSLAQAPTSPKPQYRKDRAELLRGLNGLLQQSPGYQSQEGEAQSTIPLVGELDALVIAKLPSDELIIMAPGTPEGVSFRGNNALTFVSFDQKDNNFYRIKFDDLQHPAGTNLGPLPWKPASSSDGTEMSLHKAASRIEVMSSVDGTTLYKVPSSIRVPLSTQFVDSQRMIVTGLKKGDGEPQVFQISNGPKVVTTGTKADDAIPAPSHNRKLLAVSSGKEWANTVSIYDLNSGRLVRKFPTHTHITSMAFSASDTSLYVGGKDGGVTSYRTDSGKQEWTFEQPNPPSIFRHVTSVQVSSLGAVLVLSDDMGKGEVTKLDPATGKQECEIEIGSGASMSVSPDGKKFATSDGTHFSAWNTSDGTNCFLANSLNDHTVALTYAPVWSPDSKKVAFPGETHNEGVGHISSHILIAPAEEPPKPGTA